MHHLAAPYLLQNLGDGLLARPYHLLHRAHQGPHTQVQSVHRRQILLNARKRQSPHFPQRRNQTHQVDPQPRLAHHLAPQLHLGRAALAAARAFPFPILVLHHPDRRQRHLNNFPPPLHPAPHQAGMAGRTLLHHMHHHLVRLLAAPAGELLLPLLPGTLSP